MYGGISLRRVSRHRLNRARWRLVDRTKELARLRRQYDIVTEVELPEDTPEEARAVFERYWNAVQLTHTQHRAIVREIERRGRLIGNEMTHGI